MLVKKNKALFHYVTDIRLFFDCFFFLVLLKTPVEIMASHNDWWITDGDDWLKATLIAAPILIVFGLILIAYRLHGKRTSSYIYKPGSQTRIYGSVYEPTTCAIDENVCSDEEIHATVAYPHSPSVLTMSKEQQQCKTRTEAD